MTMQNTQRTTRNRFFAGTTALALFLTATSAFAEEPEGEQGDKHVAGMSIVGNDESPKSLVIVPWKSSDLGDDLDPTRRFRQDRLPLDPEVFGRTLDYHAIRTGQDR